MMNLDKKRLLGDIEFLKTGVRDNLTPNSIYSRILKRDGRLSSTYYQVFKELGFKRNVYDFKNYYLKNEDEDANEPCISKIEIFKETKVVMITFSRVCSEQFRYDIHTLIALLKLEEYDIYFEGLIKDWTGVKEWI